MAGILLDTHALFWLTRGDEVLSESALLAISQNQEVGTLLVSPISAWELAVATIKTRVADRPNLGGDPADRWFRAAVRAASAKVVLINQRISCEAAQVVVDTGHRDPGDCFLIATARVKRIPIVTRDGFMHRLSAADPGYLSVVAC